MDTVSEVTAASNALSALLEAAAGPRGLRHPRHAKTVGASRAQVERVMRAYFRRQEAALLHEIKPKIAGAQAMHEASTPNGKRFAANLLPSSLHPLRFPVTHAEDHEYQDAITSAITGAARVMAAEIKSGATISDDVASRYLRDNSLSKLTGNLNEVSVDRLRNAIADAWDKGGSYDQIVEAIRETFADFSEVRAGLIAETEVAGAYNHGRDSIARDMGYDEHGWETESGDPCEDCEANEAQEYIGIDEAFQSGDDAPPAHPRCMCVLTFRKGAESPEEGEERWAGDGEE